MPRKGSGLRDFSHDSLEKSEGGTLLNLEGGEKAVVQPLSLGGENPNTVGRLMYNAA